MNKHIASGSAKKESSVMDLFEAHDNFQALKDEYNKAKIRLAAIEAELSMSVEGRKFLEVRRFHD